jgi:AraC family transcriptional regulator
LTSSEVRGGEVYLAQSSSVGTKWNDVVVEQHHFPSSEMADLMYKQHVIVINVGCAMTCEYRKEGQFRRFFKARGAISFFPSGQSFFLRSKLERGMFANVLFLALDPVFVSRIAEGLELDSEGIELIEQRRSADPTLHHIAMAFRAGVQSGDGLDRMYGEGLSTALAAHLLREYGAAVLKPKIQNGGLARGKLTRSRIRLERVSEAVRYCDPRNFLSKGFNLPVADQVGERFGGYAR